ncbi:DNA polymerase-like [Zingiber officinale]|uniref:DNA polymerase-like n=1 Tax=Zingiber officinale TaxID=94328 RepID=UPI001C4C6C5B|nr:DNA polymerase-like [Zingiber officinale]
MENAKDKGKARAKEKEKANEKAKAKPLDKANSKAITIGEQKFHSLNFWRSATPQLDFSLWEDLQRHISSIRGESLYSGCFQVIANFRDPYPLAVNGGLLVLSFFQLLELYVYHLTSSCIKFNMVTRLVYDSIVKQVSCYGERHESAAVKCAIMRIYYKSSGESVQEICPIQKDSTELISNIMGVMATPSVENLNLPRVESLKRKKSRKSKILTSIKRPSSQLEPRPFMVADIETVLLNDVHVPYAIGYLAVYPSLDLSSVAPSSIHIADSFNSFSSLEEESQVILSRFIYDLEIAGRRDPRLRTVYFHNFARFDGLFLLKHLASFHKDFKIKQLIREHRLYELKIYLGERHLSRFRDSCTLLPRSLAELAHTFCPELGFKGSINHEAVNISNLLSLREEYVRYLRQDVLLLGGVMRKAQETYFFKYHIDVENVMTMSALSLCIFRTHYYEPDLFPICTLTKNQDSFIRRGFYGGHSDVYIPYGENLLYYDMNSLYPHVMKKYSLPCGEPFWRNNLTKVDLGTLFGFVEASVVCPKELRRPFLPYKSSDTLIFGTGHFVGGLFFFEKRSGSPFASIISSLYELRKEAKKAGFEAMSFILKLCMNSLFGRFGMDPEGQVSEICSFSRYEELLVQSGFRSTDKLDDDVYLVNYRRNIRHLSAEEWRPPRNLAIQISAAISAYA